LSITPAPQRRVGRGPGPRRSAGPARLLMPPNRASASRRAQADGEAAAQSPAAADRGRVSARRSRSPTRGRVRKTTPGRGVTSARTFTASLAGANPSTASGPCVSTSPANDECDRRCHVKPFQPGPISHPKANISAATIARSETLTISPAESARGSRPAIVASLRGNRGQSWQTIHAHVVIVPPGCHVW